MNTIKLIKSDFKKYHNYGSNFFVIIFLTQGFWATFQYRIANAISRNITLQPFRFLCMFPMYLWQKIIEVVTGISIPASVIIGDSFYIAHFGGIVINSKTIIGNNCNISQGVTIGVSGLDQNRGVPVIGDNVYIGANSVLAGKITIGNNVLIGACSLINSSFNDNAVVIGVPGKLISEKGSKGYI
ncbi:serine O-acetyltransferase [Flavobacterium sp.]|uniref:serine O-acetyltransferase n=1 Tax=Flavobacterium sp. TaxID=239 RepID=UPI003752653D